MNEVIKTSNTIPASTTPVGWLRGEIDRLFDDFPLAGRSIFNFATRAVGPVPAMELINGDTAYQLTAELPGLTEKDVTVELADGVLTIAGMKSEETEHKEGGCLMTERRYGSFRRQFELPDDGDADSIEASVRHGVLTIKIGKDAKKTSAPRKIEIQS